jgi:type II restriction enzyme
LNYQVWIASNDQGRPFGNGKLGDGCLTDLPEPLSRSAGIDAVRLIDVLWLDTASNQVVAAYEVEHTTSIYSGIVRLLDLAFGSANPATHGLYLVAPDGREEEVRSQLQRPAFRQIANLEVRYLPYTELEKHREPISRFGEGMKAIRAISRPMP